MRFQRPRAVADLTRAVMREGWHGEGRDLRGHQCIALDALRPVAEAVSFLSARLAAR